MHQDCLNFFMRVVPLPEFLSNVPDKIRLFNIPLLPITLSKID